jgi:hypothetical protein
LVNAVHIDLGRHLAIVPLDECAVEADLCRELAAESNQKFIRALLMTVRIDTLGCRN